MSEYFTLKDSARSLLLRLEISSALSTLQAAPSLLSYTMYTMHQWWVAQCTTLQRSFLFPVESSHSNCNVGCRQLCPKASVQRALQHCNITLQHCIATLPHNSLYEVSVDFFPITKNSHSIKPLYTVRVIYQVHDTFRLEDLTLNLKL